MWSKLFSWSNQKKTEIQPQAQPTPTEMVRLAVAEIDKNIAQNQQSLQETKATQVHIQARLKEQIIELNSLTTQAENALKKKDELNAQNLLTKKVWLQEQAQQYQNLLAQLAHTIQQLEKQVAGLEMRKLEINTKETLLTAQLQKATSQKEMQNYLGELDKTLGFDSYERQIEAINIENQLANDILAFDVALENTQPNLQQLQKQVEHEQQETQTQKMNAIFGRYFDTQKEKKTVQAQDFKAMRQDLLSSFFQDKSNLPTQTDTQTTQKSQVISAFFAEKPTEPKQDKQKQIDDFFRK